MLFCVSCCLGTMKLVNNAANMQMYTEEYSAAITYTRIICVFVED